MKCSIPYVLSYLALCTKLSKMKFFGPQGAHSLVKDKLADNYNKSVMSSMSVNAG